MYDNLILKLRNTDVSSTDFLSETSQYFDVSNENNFNGNIVLSGSLNNDFNVTLNRGYIKLSGSLCKWFLGDNFQTLHRSDTKMAIEKISDTLHLPFDKSTVSRIDVAQNFIVKQLVENYYNHFGEWVDGNKKSTRAPMTESGKIEGIYYYQRLGLLVFYDKIKEQTVKNRPIPELYQNRNVLRYEQRYKSRLSEAFNIESVTASTLYDEKFYINLLNKWKENYFNIKKINDISINLSTMKTKTDLYNLGVLALVEIAGGELNIINQMKEAQRSGVLSKKQAYDLKQAITSACKEKADVTVKNDCITELDKKIAEAVRHYR